MASALQQQVCGQMQRINTQENPAVPEYPSTSFLIFSSMNADCVLEEIQLIYVNLTDADVEALTIL